VWLVLVMFAIAQVAAGLGVGMGVLELAVASLCCLLHVFLLKTLK
jgi:hypothetical protein